jgi:hypothetical protein
LSFTRAAVPVAPADTADAQNVPTDKTLTVYSENIPGAEIPQTEDLLTGALSRSPAVIPALQPASPVKRNDFYLARMVLETARTTNPPAMGVAGYTLGQ